MKSLKSSLKVLAAIFAGVFLLNMVVMYVVFHINVLDPRASLRDRLKTAQAGSGGLLAAALEEKLAGNNGSKENDPAKAFESNMLSQNSVSGTGLEEPGTVGGEPVSGDADTEAFHIYKSYDYYLTSDEVAYLSKISLEDKLAAMTILSKLSTEELDRIYNITLDGVTYKEFSDIKASLGKKLSSSDVEALKGILDKNKKLYAEKGR